jgi:NADPH:quinone reductase-like Zn-dependent oxidoreductase
VVSSRDIDGGLTTVTFRDVDLGDKVAHGCLFELLGALRPQLTRGPSRTGSLPDSADPLEAVAVLHPAASAHLALIAHGNLRAGDTVRTAGGAVHVGRAAIVIAGARRG